MTTLLARFLFAFTILFSLAAVAQQDPPPASSSSSPQTSQETQSTPQDKTPQNKKDEPGKSAPGQAAGTPSSSTPASGTSNDRLFYALPNFLTLENGAHVPPLTGKQKFKVVARSSFDYVQVPWYLFLAGISQAEDSEPGYGQGAEGYGKRFGSAFADGTIENFMTGAVLPSVLHQDPRFFQSSEGGFAHRAGYAVSRIFITRTDSGNRQFNYSEIFGSALSAGISTYSYHPRADKTLDNTASVWGSEVGYDTVTILIKEFWPDIRRKLSKKK